MTPFPVSERLHQRCRVPWHGSDDTEHVSVQVIVNNVNNTPSTGLYLPLKQ